MTAARRPLFAFNSRVRFSESFGLRTRLSTSCFYAMDHMFVSMDVGWDTREQEQRAEHYYIARTIHKYWQLLCIAVPSTRLGLYPAEKRALCPLESAGSKRTGA